RLGYWRWTAADNRVQWFGDHAALFGITDAEFGGTLDDVQKHVHPDDRSMGMKNISRAVDERIPFDNTYRVVHPDGSIHWLNSFGRVTFDDAGNPLSMFGITRDISQYKFAQEALEERLAQLTVLLNSMQCGVLVENNQRRILFANQDFSGIFGVPAPEDILGANCAEHLPEAADLFIDPDGFISGIEHCIATGNVVANELLHMKDGRVLERTYAPILRDQRTFGHLWIYRDQTEQIRLQQNYRTLFVEMLSGFAVHDIICDDTGRPVDYRFLDINPAFEKLTGLGRDIIGKTVLEVLPGTEPYWIETYGQVALTGEPAHFDNYSVALDRHYEVSAFRTAPGQFACL
ncbi:MAG: PAS domain S-box protein, partial [Spartobacteria bacterium]|nr:PAS domain S-box protein [Spartobacteria bacterium]